MTNDDDQVDELFETMPRPQVEYTINEMPNGLNISAKTHVKFMENLQRAIDKAAAYSKAPSLETALVGATGNQFTNTNQLHVLTYWEAMASGNKAQWLEAVEDE